MSKLEELQNWREGGQIILGRKRPEVTAKGGKLQERRRGSGSMGWGGVGGWTVEVWWAREKQNGWLSWKHGRKGERWVSFLGSCAVWMCHIFPSSHFHESWIWVWFDCVTCQDWLKDGSVLLQLLWLFNIYLSFYPVALGLIVQFPGSVNCCHHYMSRTILIFLAFLAWK